LWIRIGANTHWEIHCLHLQVILLILLANYRIEYYIKYRSIKNFIRKVNDCYEKSGKEKREDLTKKAVNIVETVKDTVQKNAETVKDTAAHATQEVFNVIKDVHEKMESVKKDIQDDHEIAQDIH
jgi:RAB protein geranylgeranyltransferase component A